MLEEHGKVIRREVSKAPQRCHKVPPAEKEQASTFIQRNVKNKIRSMLTVQLERGKVCICFQINWEYFLTIDHELSQFENQQLKLNKRTRQWFRITMPNYTRKRQMDSGGDNRKESIKMACFNIRSNPTKCHRLVFLHRRSVPFSAQRYLRVSVNLQIEPHCERHVSARVAHSKLRSVLDGGIC